MKKTLSMLLVIIMIFSVMAYAGVAYAKNNTSYFRPTAWLDDGVFTQMTPQQQAEYLFTLGTEDEITQLLSQLNEEQLQLLLNILSDEQLAVLGKYLDNNEEPAVSDTQAEEPGEPANESADSGISAGEAPEDKTLPVPAYEDKPADDTAADTPGDTTDDATDVAAEQPPVDYSAMSPQELYEYLCALDSAETSAVLAALTLEQFNALEAYMLTLESNILAPAVNYTDAAPFKDPVQVDIPKSARKMALQAATPAVQEVAEDALVTNKAVSGTNGSYLLTIDAYATGDVTITTGQTPVPADIILVLDVSLSMDYNMTVNTYTPATYNTNSAAYTNRSNLYVKVGSQYYSVAIERVRTHVDPNRYRYTYTVNGTPLVYTSDNDAAGDFPPAWAFYSYSQSSVSRLSALKTAANNFIDSIETKANANGGVSHRIAVVTYSTNASIISGSNSGNAFVNVQSNTGGINTLQSTISNLRSVEYTSADRGLKLASDIFRDDLPDTGGLRNRVVVFFTDGAPSRGSGGVFQTDVANPAIANAKTLKAAVSASGYGATVYSVGIFDGANPATSIGSASNENKFMHFVSSNYPNAASMTNYGAGSNAGYYLSASSADGLNNIFQSISQNIETGGTTVTLDEDSVVKDMIAPYFELPDGVDEDDILVYTSAVNASTGAWQTPQPFDGTVVISEDGRTVGVSGFDYKDNYYVAVKNEQGTIVEYRGKKLIFTIPIKYIEHSCLGGLVPTNLGSSGIYDHNSMGQEVLVEALPIPEVPIPVDYDYTAVDRSVYLRQSVKVSDLFTDAQSYYIPNKVNNAYVDIVYTVRDDQNNLLGTFTIPKGADHGTWNPADPTLTGLTGNKTYFISCTVTPNSASIAAPTIGKCAYVYVFKPQITYRDSTIYLGETANYGDNFVNAEWKNSVTSAPAPSSPAPALSYAYSPAAGAFRADTYVNAAVYLNAEDVTGYTAFVHKAAPGSEFDPAKGEFIVFVKSCMLTVSKAGAADDTDTFVFTVKNDSGLELKISMQGNGNQTISGLPVGHYTVAEVPSWSWRYTAGSESVNLSREHSNGTVTVNNRVTNNRWLAGDSWAANLFSH